MVLCIVVFQLVNSCIPVQESKAQLQVSFQVFYDELSPHGNWMHHDRYGFVWSPGLSPDFFPYGTNGYWIYSQAGWTWISEYSWGWAPFHYGRWFLDRYYGWIWVPGYEWAPAWVVWRSCNGYYGWTPWEPEIAINWALAPQYHYEQRFWRFVRRSDMGRTDIGNHFEGMGQYIQFLNSSKVIDNKKMSDDDRVAYHAGPMKEEVELHVGKKINPTVIVGTSTPGQMVDNEKVMLYKPKIERTPIEQTAPQPKQVKPWQQETIIEQDKINERLPIKEQPIEKKELPIQNQPKLRPPDKINESTHPQVKPEKPAIQRPIPTPQKVPSKVQSPSQIRQAPVKPVKPTAPIQKQAYPIDEKPEKPLIPKSRPTEVVDNCCD